jgi:hypothetical protein
MNPRSRSQLDNARLVKRQQLAKALELAEGIRKVTGKTRYIRNVKEIQEKYDG